MAQYDRLVTGDPDQLLAHLDEAIVTGSMTAQLEHATDHRIGDARMSVRVYERYSASGGNRLSLCVSVLAVGTELAVSLATAGGSNALLWKLNTIGEETFLDLAVRALEDFTSRPARDASPDRGYMDADGR